MVIRKSHTTATYTIIINRKMKKLLYINDYACTPEVYKICSDGNYPESHLWGIKEYVDTHGKKKIKWHLISKSRSHPTLRHILEIIRVFILNWKCDIIYSALPGYDWLFLLAKKLRIKNYKIITVVHHPKSRLILHNQYSKLVFISKISYNRYCHLSNAIYLFWGPDLNFYSRICPKEIKYDFIAAGKTHRDYGLMKSSLQKLNLSFRIFGDKSETNNSVSYPELLRFYSESKFICIPMKNVDPSGGTLIGLTSLVDALALGIPVLISDNSQLGIDIEGLKLGYVYKTEDAHDFEKKIKQILQMSEEDYNIMKCNCKNFAKANSFRKFSDTINCILNE